MWESRHHTSAQGERSSSEVTRTPTVQGFIDHNQQLVLHPKQIGTTRAQLCLVQYVPWSQVLSASGSQAWNYWTPL